MTTAGASAAADPVPTSKDAPPGRLVVSPGGALEGATGSYVKRLRDMAGVYRDSAAHDAQLAERGGDTEVYRVEEHRTGSGPGSLVVGTSTLLPGRVGRELAMTRGHLHARPEHAELYHCLSGRGLLLLETVDGESQAVEMGPGTVVHVPGHWVHRSVNTGDEPFVTLFCYAQDAGQDYALLERAGGCAQLVVTDDGTAGGWRLEPNPDHRGYAPADAEER